MSFSERLKRELPLLRRYARALTGSQDRGDALVRSVLVRATENSKYKEEIASSKPALFSAFTRMFTQQIETKSAPGPAAGSLEKKAGERLAKIAPTSRQALLLTTLENFSIQESATILGISREEVEKQVQAAVEEIDKETKTSVLIIEDEPLIAMQLEDLIRSLGHDVCGTAATRDQAREVIGQSSPGLVLADIQLADGSSGLDAVDDILAMMNVPVIFITAFPERLLTGDRREPTYLITKPFKERTVRAAVSQALFFQSSAPLPH
ncbi:response regulator [Erythrobacter sp. W53]|uniref:response regulator n=1 Tax=Erythrobacter sp. W53 TaxID=3425947 RepID=UPI003D767AA7